MFYYGVVQAKQEPETHHRLLQLHWFISIGFIAKEYIGSVPKGPICFSANFQVVDAATILNS